MRTAPSELSPTSELKADDSAEVKPAEMYCLERQSFGQQQYSALDTQVAFTKQHLIFDPPPKILQPAFQSSIPLASGQGRRWRIRVSLATYAYVYWMSEIVG